MENPINEDTNLSFGVEDIYVPPLNAIDPEPIQFDFLDIMGYECDHGLPPVVPYYTDSDILFSVCGGGNWVAKHCEVYLHFKNVENSCTPTMNAWVDYCQFLPTYGFDKRICIAANFAFDRVLYAWMSRNEGNHINYAAFTISYFELYALCHFYLCKTLADMKLFEDTYAISSQKVVEMLVNHLSHGLYDAEPSGGFKYLIAFGRVMSMVDRPVIVDNQFRTLAGDMKFGYSDVDALSFKFEALTLQNFSWYAYFYGALVEFRNESVRSDTVKYLDVTHLVTNHSIIHMLTPRGDRIDIYRLILTSGKGSGIPQLLELHIPSHPDMACLRTIWYMSSKIREILKNIRRNFGSVISLRNDVGAVDYNFLQMNNNQVNAYANSHSITSSLLWVVASTGPNKCFNTGTEIHIVPKRYTNFDTWINDRCPLNAGTYIAHIDDGTPHEYRILN